MTTLDVNMHVMMKKMVDMPNKVQAQGDTVEQLIRDLERQYPKLKGHVIDGKGNLKRTLLVLVNNEDIRGLNGLDTPVKTEDVFSIMLASSGG